MLIHFLFGDSENFLKEMVNYDTPLKEFSQRPYKPKSNRISYSIVDWNKRDSELYYKVQNCINLIKKDIKHKRITFNLIERLISYDFNRKEEKLPKTMKLIQGYLETESQYHIRKINWAIQELINKNKKISISNICNYAGIKSNHDRYATYINSIIFEKNNDFLRIKIEE